MHKPSEDRITGVNIEGNKGPVEEQLLYWFRDMAKAASEMDLPAMDTTVLFLEDDDEFVPGTYVPELRLIVRRVEDDEDYQARHPTK